MAKRQKSTSRAAPAKAVVASAPQSVAAAASTRIDLLDVLRALAILMMFVYHFCFDLSWFGIIEQNPYQDPRWIASRSVILSSFLLLVGIGLAFAQATGWQWTRYRQRLAQIVGCAALVSIGSRALFPESWIWFGVLHHIALASVLALAFLRAPGVALIVGVALVALGTFISAAFFDQKAWQWFGLMTFKPRTEDYVPLLPWFGVVLIGLYIGHRLAQPPMRARLATWRAQHPLARLMVWAGRHSLLLYMLHQPVFIGLLMLVNGLPPTA